MLPNFLLIGAMKSGTTSLHRLLRQHRDIFMPAVKELHYFALEPCWLRGPEWYESCFDEHGGARRVGEASASYTKNKRPQLVAERIAAMLPEVQLIYIARNPVDRMLSHYKHLLGNGVRKSFATCIRTQDLVEVSCHYDRLSYFFEHYPEDRIKIVFFDDLIENPNAVMSALFSFLGVDDSFVPRNMKQAHNTSETKFARLETEDRDGIQKLLSDYGILGPRLRQSVVSRLRSDLQEFSRFTGRRLDHWDPEARIGRYFPEGDVGPRAAG